MAAIPDQDYLIRLVVIDKTGIWRLMEPHQLLAISNNPRQIKIDYSQLPTVILQPAHPKALLGIIMGDRIIQTHPVDTVWPILHGQNGEDGTIQGMLQLFGIPCVGNGITASAIGMDKQLSKRLLEAAHLPVVPYTTVYQDRLPHPDFDELCRRFNCGALFVKAAHSGSSVGIYKAHHASEFLDYLQQAFQYDTKVLIEMALEKPREIEIAILQDREQILVSLPGEVIPNHEFYDYDAKYVDDNGAVLKAPADLDDRMIRDLQNAARDIFKILENQGLLRVDFFVCSNRQWYLNEVNTMPGFTAISMYPKLIHLSGLTYPELIRKLIDFSLIPH